MHGFLAALWEQSGTFRCLSPFGTRWAARKSTVVMPLARRKSTLPEMERADEAPLVPDHGETDAPSEAVRAESPQAKPAAQKPETKTEFSLKRTLRRHPYAAAAAAVF